LLRLSRCGLWPAVQLALPPPWPAGQPAPPVAQLESPSVGPEREPAAQPLFPERLRR
jgi:hypothetical protein